jgi:Holliday junction resolvase
MDNWKNLCSLITPLINGVVSETVYHSSFITWLNLIFHWENDKIKDEVPVQMGSTKKADIVLEGNDFNIVIEMKKPSIKLENDQAGQLIAYMRILGSKYKYGMLIGNKLKLFYVNDPNKELHEIKEIVSLDFDPNNKDGIELGNLLDYTVCSDNKLKEYSESKMEYFQRIQIIEMLKRDLEANNFEKIKQILKSELSKGYDEEVIQFILDEININFRRKENQYSRQNNVNRQPIDNSCLKDIMQYYNSIRDNNFICFGSDNKYRQISIIQRVRLLHYEFYNNYNNDYIGVEIHAESKELVGLNEVLSSFTGNIKGYTIEHKMIRGRERIIILVPCSAGKEVCSIVMKELINLTYEKICVEYKRLNL